MSEFLRAVVVIGFVVSLAGCSATTERGILPEIEYDGPERVSDDLELGVNPPDSVYDSELVESQSNQTEVFSATTMKRAHVEAAKSRGVVQVEMSERYLEQVDYEDSEEWFDFTISRSAKIDFENEVAYEKWYDGLLFTERSISEYGVQSRSILPSVRVASTDEQTTGQNTTELKESLKTSLATEHFLLTDIEFSQINSSEPEEGVQEIYVSHGVESIEGQFTSDISTQSEVTDFYAVMIVQEDGLISQFEWRILVEGTDGMQFVYETRISTKTYDGVVEVPQWFVRN